MEENQVNGLEEDHTVSLDEAVGALRSIQGQIKTIAHRINVKHDDTALLFLGQIDIGEYCVVTHALVGNPMDLVSMIVRLMKEKPEFKRIITTASMAETIMPISD